jgi:hypothetical protein
MGLLMNEFYVGSEADERRCRESQRVQNPITITGQTEEGCFQPFTGTVQTIDQARIRSPSKRWRITMRDQLSSHNQKT